MFEHGQRGEDVRSLQRWLVERGAAIAVDGIWGPRSEAAWVEAGRPALPEPPPLPVGDVGIWVDKWPKEGDEAKFAETLKESGFSSASLCLWLPSAASSDLWKLGVWPSQIAALMKALRAEGLPVGWCVWGDRHQVPVQVSYLYRLVTAIGAPDWVEMDAEEQWRLASIDDATGWLEAMHRRISDLRVNFVLPASGVAPQGVQHLVSDDRVSEATLQAYTAFLSKKAWTHAAAFRPAGAYLDVCARWSPRADLKIRMGLALYGQSHPAPHPQGPEALEATWAHVMGQRAWTRGEAPNVRFWSSKHLTKQVSGWTRTLKGRTA